MGKEVYKYFEVKSEVTSIVNISENKIVKEMKEKRFREWDNQKR